MQPRLTWVQGRVAPGHGVASGRSATTPYPAGTIALQSPFFLAQGVDLSCFHPGTLNVDIAPAEAVPNPERALFDGKLKWFGDLEERFLLTPVALRFAGQAHEGLWYYPHPETKPAHFQSRGIVELLLPWIDGLRIGALVEVGLPS